jgi:hypothetical protein
LLNPEVRPLMVADVLTKPTVAMRTSLLPVVVGVAPLDTVVPVPAAACT